MSSLTELDTVQDVMSPEQTTMFDVPSLTLSVVLFACVIGSLVVSAAMFVLQLRAERARMLREARANKARRLRILSNGEEVLLPKLPVLSELVAKLYPLGPPVSAPHAGPFHVCAYVGVERGNEQQLVSLLAEERVRFPWSSSLT